MKLIYVVTEDWFFYIHRLPTMRAAVRAGFDVALITRVDQHRARIEAEGVRVIPFPFSRKSKNPITAIGNIFALANIYRRERPDIVHHIALKPILFGSLAAWLARVPRIVNGYVGLGTLFYSDIPLTRVLRPLIFPLLRAVVKRDTVWTLFENSDDAGRMTRDRMAVQDRTTIIPGSGVNIDRYQTAPMPSTPPFICMFAGRMIAMKGLQTIHDAFAILKDTAPHIKLWLCGTPDPGNPESWDEQRLTDWAASNPNVIYRGYQTDMAALWPQAHLALQPTIGGEGLPVSLLEAGACARPMIATNVPGCREVAKDGINAILIPEQDPQALADAIQSFASDGEKTTRMGLASRTLIAEKFSSTHVTQAMYDVYHSLIGTRNT